MMTLYDKIKISGFSNEEWLKLRKSGIGGSDAGAICRVNPYSNPIKVYYDKTTDDTYEADNEAVRIGHDLEEYVASRFSEATGLKVRRSNYMYRSIEHPFMIADVDRLIVGEDAGLECKTASAYNADKWKDGEIPLHYIMQCYHYMAVTGKRTWYIAAVILGQRFVWRKLAWDDALIDGLIEAETRFWNEHVIKRKIPDPDGSDVYDEVLQKYFHTAKKANEIKLYGFDDKLERRAELVKKINELETEQKQIEQEIKLFMKDNEYAISDGYKVMWSNVESARIDTKRLKEEKPDIYNEYSKVSKTRRFQIKAA